MQEDPNKITYFATTNSPRRAQMPFGIKRKDRGSTCTSSARPAWANRPCSRTWPSRTSATARGSPSSTRTARPPSASLEYVPEHRIKDVVYFAPFDMEYPIAFNVMEDVGYDKRHLVVSGLMAAFQKIWVDAW